MKDLIKRHHVATWERGMIRPETNLNDFMQKLTEEYHELYNEFAFIDDERLIPDGDFAQEAMDMVAVIFNMLIHYGFDIREEFRHNVEHQESRAGMIR